MRKRDGWRSGRGKGDGVNGELNGKEERSPKVSEEARERHGGIKNVERRGGGEVVY